MAAIAVPKYQVAVAKSRLATIRPLISSIKEAEETYFLTNGHYSDWGGCNDRHEVDWTELDINLPPKCRDRGDFEMTCDSWFRIYKMPGSCNQRLNQIRLEYCPGKNAGSRDKCRNVMDYRYIVWFSNSPTPNKIECESYTELGRKVCDSVNI